MADRVRRHRGEGALYQRADGRWVAAIDLGLVAGKRVRRTVTGPTKQAVQTKRNELRRKLDLGVLPAKTTTGEWLEHWMTHVAAKTLRPTTLKGYRSKIDQYLAPALGSVPLQQLRPEHIERMHLWMADQGLSPTTIRQAHMVLRSALKSAVQRERVTRNVAAITVAPTAALNPHEHLSSDQAKLVLRSARTPRELARLTCALVLGMRQGEVLGLRWADLIQTGDVWALLVEESVQRVDGKMTRQGVKSRASHREIPLPDAVATILKAWAKQAADAYIFPGPNGGPADPKDDWEVWRDALARAKVAHVPLHGARGSAASLLADMGVPDWRIGQILGHTAWVSRRHYIDGEAGPKRAALEGLIAELLPAPPAPAADAPR